jgi:hypothetical protein
MPDHDNVLGEESVEQAGGSSLKLGASGTRLQDSSILRNGSSLRQVILRLCTERVSIRGPVEPAGDAYAVLTVRGEFLALHESPVATEHPLSGDDVFLFRHRTTAALWAAFRAWENLADGRPPRMYRVRHIRFSGAVSCYTLRITEGPLLCDLGDVVEAKQFVIPARGQEKPKATAQVCPQKAPLPPRRYR